MKRSYLTRLAYILLLFTMAVSASHCSSRKDWAEIVESSRGSIATVFCGDEQGTGFFVDDDVVATNYHVISRHDRSAIMVKPTGAAAKHSGQLMAYDEDRDLALVKVESLRAAPFDLTGAYSQGDEIVVIGTSGGLEYSVTKGIVSAIREREGLEIIQTDAAINPGNSGGPLINEQGRVVGIAVIKVSAIDIEGIGFGISAKHLIQLRSGETGHQLAEEPQFNTTVLISLSIAAIVALAIIVAFFLRKFISIKRQRSAPFERSDILGTVRKSSVLLERNQLTQARELLETSRTALAAPLANVDKAIGLANIEGDFEAAEQLRLLIRQVDKAIDAIDRQSIEEAQKLVRPVLDQIRQENRLIGLAQESEQLLEIMDLIVKSVELRSFYRVPSLCRKLGSLRISHGWTKSWTEKIEQEATNEIKEAKTLVKDAGRELNIMHRPQAARTHAREALRKVSDHPEAKAILREAETNVEEAKGLLLEAKKCLSQRKLRKLKLAINNATVAATLDSSLNQRAKEVIVRANKQIAVEQKRVRRLFALTAATSLALAVAAYLGWQEYETWRAKEKYAQLTVTVTNTTDIGDKIALLEEYVTSHELLQYKQKASETLSGLRSKRDRKEYEGVLMRVENSSNLEEKRRILKTYLSDYQGPESLYSAFPGKHPKEKLRDIQNQLDQRDFTRLKKIARDNDLERLVAYKYYLADHPQGKHRDTVQQMIAEVRQLQKDHQKGMEADQTLHQLQYLAECEGTDYEAAKRVYTKYLANNTYCNVHLRSKIMNEIELLEAQSKWQEMVAASNNSQDALDARIRKLKDYVSLNSNGPYAAEAQKVLRRLEGELQWVEKDKHLKQEVREWKTVASYCTNHEITLANRKHKLEKYGLR